MTFTIANTAPGNAALTNLDFTDDLPAGLEVAGIPNATASASCVGASWTPAAGDTTLSFTATSLAAGATCTLEVDVKGTVSGQYNNVSSFLTINGIETTKYAEDPITVIAPPVISKSFSPTSIFTTETSILAFVIENPNDFTVLDGIGFTDLLPGGLTVAAALPAAACGSTVVITAPNTITLLTGGILAANSSCTFSVPVIGATAGTWDNETSVVTSIEGGNGNIATATLIVQDKNPGIELNKQISTSAVGPWYKTIPAVPDTNIYYRFAVYNSGDVTLVDIGVNETSQPTFNPAATIDPTACIWTDDDPVQTAPANLDPGYTAYCVLGPFTTNTDLGVIDNVAKAVGDYNSITYSSPNSTASYATPELTLTKTADVAYFTTDGETIKL